MTNPAVQRSLGLAASLRGTMLQQMILPDGAVVPAALAARPFVEPDRVVQVVYEGLPGHPSVSVRLQ